MTEADLMRVCQLAATQNGARLLRNNVALAWVGKLASGYPKNGSVLLLNARPLHAGLAVGSGDLIGLNSQGRFLSIETKLPGRRATPEQTAWKEMVIRLGGSAGTAYSVEDAVALIAGV
jgi:hypothetical protein